MGSSLSSQNSTLSADRTPNLRGRPRRLDWAQLETLAGTMSDCEVGRRLGCHPSYVVRWRQAHGVAKHDPLEEFLDMLGYVADGEIARLAGVQTRTVRQRRERIGIVPARAHLHNAAH